eukprot:scaffold9243_cov162-Amphora_coffeaeformis.AAC.3
MVAIMTGWSKDPVRPSKIPQSGPAAEAISVVAVHMAAVAKAALGARSPDKNDEMESCWSWERSSTWWGSFSSPIMAMRDGVRTDGLRAVKASDPNERRATTNAVVFMMELFVDNDDDNGYYSCVVVIYDTERMRDHPTIHHHSLLIALFLVLTTAQKILPLDRHPTRHSRDIESRMPGPFRHLELFRCS